MGPARLPWLVARREFAVERAARDLTVTVVPFVGATLLLAGLAFGPDPTRLQGTAPGVVWLAVLFAAVMMAQQVASTERAEGCWDLLCTQVSPAGLFLGKLAAAWLWLMMTWVGTALLALVLFDATMPAMAFGAGLLGTLGVAATTVTLGVLTGGSHRRGGLLAVLLLPASLPALLAGVASADPASSQEPVWLALLVAYDAVAVTAAWAVFPMMLEE